MRPFSKVFKAQPCAGRSQWAEHEDIKLFFEIRKFKENIIYISFIDYVNILYLERSISRNCELYIPKSWDQG